MATKLFLKTPLKKRARTGDNSSATEHVSVFQMSQLAVMRFPNWSEHFPPGVTPISSFVISISNKSHMQSPSGRYIIR